MPRRKPSLQLALDQLADDFVAAVLDAVRHATLAELFAEEGGALDTPGAAPARQRRRRRQPRAVARAPQQAPTPAATPDPVPCAEPAAESPTSPLAVEAEPAATLVAPELDAEATEIDAVAMLASLERQAAALEGAPESARLPAILTVVPAADLEATLMLGARARRAGEDVLRTASGSVVLRRRRAPTESAA